MFGVTVDRSGSWSRGVDVMVAVWWDCWQVSQLVEDRTYLNTQLGTMSRSLREKESEWTAIRQQYATLHQTHINTQAKVRHC